MKRLTKEEDIRLEKARKKLDEARKRLEKAQKKDAKLEPEPEDGGESI